MRELTRKIVVGLIFAVALVAAACQTPSNPGDTPQQPALLIPYRVSGFIDEAGNWTPFGTELTVWVAQSDAAFVPLEPIR